MFALPLLLTLPPQIPFNSGIVPAGAQVRHRQIAATPNIGRLIMPAFRGARSAKKKGCAFKVVGSLLQLGGRPS